MRATPLPAMIDIGADLSDNDVHALYSYFMHAVKPVG
ncbi:hypothetical protein BCEP27_30345 [Burkholderia cepacia]